MRHWRAKTVTLHRGALAVRPPRRRAAGAPAADRRQGRPEGSVDSEAAERRGRLRGAADAGRRGPHRHLGRGAPSRTGWSEQSFFRPGRPLAAGSPGDGAYRACLRGQGADLGAVPLSGEQRVAVREMLEGLDLEVGLDRLLELGQAAGVLPAGVGKPWLRERFAAFRRLKTSVESYVPRPYGAPHPGRGPLLPAPEAGPRSSGGAPGERSRSRRGRIPALICGGVVDLPPSRSTRG
jgi:hypothetical protein